MNGLGLSSIPAIDLVLDSDSSNALWLNDNPVNDWTNLPNDVCTLGIAGCEIDSLNTAPIPNDLKTLWCGGPMLESLKELPYFANLVDFAFELIPARYQRELQIFNDSVIKY